MENSDDEKMTRREFIEEALLAVAKPGLGAAIGAGVGLTGTSIERSRRGRLVWRDPVDKEEFNKIGTMAAAGALTALALSDEDTDPQITPTHQSREDARQNKKSTNEKDKTP